MTATATAPNADAGRTSQTLARAPRSAPVRILPCAWQAFDSVRKPIALSDANGRLIYANYAFTSFIARASSSAEGGETITLDQIFGDPAQAEILVRAIGRGEAMSADVELFGVGGVRVHLRVAIDPLEPGISGGDIVGPRALVVLDDLSKEVMALEQAADRELSQRATIASLEDSGARLEGHAANVASLVDSLALARDEAERANATKSEFLAMISHEIRTPLNGVLGMLWLLLESQLDARQRECAQTAKDSAEALLTVINDVLDFSKMEAGRLELERIVYNVTSVVSGIVKLLEVKAGEKGLALRVQMDPKVPASLFGDPARLRQILLNLIGKAIKFTEKGWVALTVARLEDAAAGGAMLRFEVRDTGIGIAEGDRHKLFEKFSQVDSSVTRRHGGTGLGLAICHRLVTMMGGAIGVDSQPGYGSSFWFTLPCESVSAGKPSALAADLTHARIVLTGASADHPRSLVDALKATDASVDIAALQAEALDQLRDLVERSGRPPVALYLAGALGDDAESFARRVRADRQLSEVSQVLLVKSGLRGDASRSKDLGFAAYLTEPLDSELLLRCLREIDSAMDTGTAAKAPLITVHSLREAIGRIPMVLVAEDHPVNQRLAAALMKRLGCEVVIVGDGAQAVERVKAGGIDVVLMDIQMSGMDGMSASRAIRELGADVRHVPIIAMTAHAMAGDEEKCRSAGMDDYVPKPIEPERLKSTLLRWLHRRVEPDAAPTDAVPVAAPGAPVLDRSLVEQLEVALGRSSVVELVQLFLETTVERLQALDQAITTGDVIAIRSEAHDLKSTSGNLGARRLWAQARALEVAARDEAIEVVRDLATPIRAQFDAVQAAFGARYPA